MVKLCIKKLAPICNMHVCQLHEYIDRGEEMHQIAREVFLKGGVKISYQKQLKSNGLPDQLKAARKFYVSRSNFWSCTF